MRLSFLLLTVFVDMLGLGLIVPIVPALLGDVTGSPAAAVLWSGVLGSLFGLLQFAGSPLLGRLSDRYGRRPVLLVSLSCLGVDWLAHALSSGPWTLVFFHALAGAFAGTNTVVNAYIADVTPPSGRARAYGLVGSAFALGFVAGPTIGGLLGAVDVRLPFYAAAALSFANVAYGWLVLPESRPGDLRRTNPSAATVTARAANRSGATTQPGATTQARVTTQPGAATRPGAIAALRAANPVSAIVAVLRRPVLGRLALARFCADVARMTHQSTWAFFLTHQFGWGTARIGFVMAAGAVAGAVFQARAVGPIVRWLGERRAAVLGSLVGAAVFAGTAFVSVPWMLYALMAVGVLGSVGGAAAQAWISRSVGDDEQGSVQGALTGIGAVAETFVPVVAGAAFGALIAYQMTGLIFVGAALFAGGSTLLLVFAGGRKGDHHGDAGVAGLGGRVATVRLGELADDPEA